MSDQNKVKKYLVSYLVGPGMIDSTIVETDLDYTPVMDNLMLIKKSVIHDKMPIWNEWGHGSHYPIDASELRIISISNLDS